MQTRTCLNCGWVSFGVSREYAEEQVREFNEFFDASSPEVRASYGNRKTDMSHYTQCFRCAGQYTNFRDSVDGDCPIGCTLQPIVVDNA